MSRAIEPTPVDALDRAVETVAENQNRFAKLGIRQRIALLKQMADDTFRVSEQQVESAVRAKGIPLGSNYVAEEWLGGPMTTLRNLRLLQLSLDAIERKGGPRVADSAIHDVADGRIAVDVFPYEGVDKLLFTGFTAQIWQQPEVNRQNLTENMAHTYQGQNQDGKVALVLGAGNVASIGPMDVLYKMFVENQVCVLKMNPVNENLGPWIEKGFRAAIDAGYFRVVYGGATEGDHLVHHDDVDEIHITGSDKVHDMIVWGVGEDQQTRKAANDPKLKKRITSELGCVTPIIITPGEWTRAELEFQAQNVATMIVNNASFNCNAAKLLVTAANWPQRGAFLTRLREILAQLPPRHAYYPGAHERYERFTEAYGHAHEIGTPATGALPWAIATGLDPNADEMAFTNEAWCSFIAETPLDVRSVDEFLHKATAFCNDTVWGTLSCSLLIDPRTAKRNKNALEKAIADLRYGSVMINHWPGLSYGLVVSTWGAHPGHTLDNIESGIGVVHNSLMFEKPQKTVIRGPFVVKPKPPWLSTHKNSPAVARRLTDFEYQPSLLKVPAIALNAMRG